MARGGGPSCTERSHALDRCESVIMTRRSPARRTYCSTYTIVLEEFVTFHGISVNLLEKYVYSRVYIRVGRFKGQSLNREA